MAKRSITETSPIEVYRLLPRTNCAECGEPNCMAFATRLVNRELTLEACPPLLRPEYAGDLGELEALLAPPVRAVRIGDGPTAVTVGGKYVVQRHEFTYHHPTACAMAVDDALSLDELAERVRTAADFSYNYIGRDLRLDAIAVRSVTGDPERFREAVGTVAGACDLPLLLCSPDPGVLRAGLEAAPGRRPLLYAADRTNWREMAELALEAHCPLAVSAPDDLAGLRSLTKTLRAWGLADLVLDPGTFPGPGLARTLRNFARCRYAAIRGGDDLLGYPLLGAPLAAFTGEELDPVGARSTRRSRPRPSSRGTRTSWSCRGSRAGPCSRPCSGGSTSTRTPGSRSRSSRACASSATPTARAPCWSRRTTP